VVVSGGSTPANQVRAVSEHSAAANVDVYPPGIIRGDMCIEVVHASTFGIEDRNSVEGNVDRFAEPQRDLPRRASVHVH
jgi:hypothetical protein